MANGQQKAKQNVESFKSWAAAMRDEDFVQIVYRGQLNRNEVAKGVNCARSALRQNPRLANMLAELEDSLRQRGVLPDLSNQAASEENKPVRHDQNARRQAQEAKRAAKLEQENLELKAKIKALERQLSRYVELSEALGEYGIIPQ